MTEKYLPADFVHHLRRLLNFPDIEKSSEAEKLAFYNTWLELSALPLNAYIPF
uniref:Uncharacterized protein n=1 Tax=Cyanothece sp. (strain PCC 7425 / ATCC 29141) TaxID=395961 RepID=B8HN19_CYAP4